MSSLYFALDGLRELVRAEVEGIAAAVLERARRAALRVLGDIDQRAHPPTPHRSSPVNLDLCAWPCARVIDGQLCGGTIQSGACRRCGSVYRAPRSDEKPPAA